MIEQPIPKNYQLSEIQDNLTTGENCSQLSTVKYDCQPAADRGLKSQYPI